MRQLILDTETTGLEPEQGHRIVEVACVEIFNRRFTHNNFHRYLNPERESDPGALQVHGLTTEFLQDQPKFADVAQDFLNFIQGAELIIHNAPFDVAFLNAELARLALEPVTTYCAKITDSLRMAKDLHPGKRNSLDALCERYEVDNSGRTLHGALLDAELLGDVFIAMTRGQESFFIEALLEQPTRIKERLVPRNLIVLKPTEDELAIHMDHLAKIDKASKGNCLWLKETTPPIEQ